MENNNESNNMFPMFMLLEIAKMFSEFPGNKYKMTTSDIINAVNNSELPNHTKIQIIDLLN